MFQRLSAFFVLLLLFVISSPAYAANEITYISQESRQNTILVLAGITLFTVLMGLFWARQNRHQHTRLWMLAGFFTLLCVVGIGIVWYMAIHRSPDEGRTDETFLLAQEAIDAEIAAAVAAADASGEDRPIIVPTGVFIQSMEFDSANNVQITGYVWQRYPPNLPEDFVYGFVMPEGDTTTAEEAYRFTDGEDTIIGWYISTTLRQNFDYRLFPFDKQDIWLRLWAADFQYTSLLVPDLASYEPDWTPTELPGLESDFVLEHWLVDRTFFSNYANTYNTTFGIPGYEVNDITPELYFNISVKRDIVDAFIGHLIPMGIVILMAFGVQFIITQVPDKMSYHGINTIGVMAYCASLFFIAILAQLSVRDELNASTVTYLEYFYFVLYVVLLLITINSILFAVSDRFAFLEYEDNFYPKVLFAPITAVLLLSVTLMAFY